MFRMPAAAVPLGSVVSVAEHYGYVDLTVVKIDNATPVPGKVTLWYNDGGSLTYGGAELVNVVSLPEG